MKMQNTAGPLSSAARFTLGRINLVAVEIDALKNLNLRDCDSPDTKNSYSMG